MIQVLQGSAHSTGGRWGIAAGRPVGLSLSLSYPPLDLLQLLSLERAQQALARGGERARVKFMWFPLLGLPRWVCIPTSPNMGMPGYVAREWARKRNM